MSVNHVYHTWLERIRQLRPKERITRLRNFAWIVAGILMSRSVHLSYIAEKIPGVATTVSKTRRISRFLDNSAIRVREWYAPVARDLLAAAVAHGLEVRLVTDGTKVGFGHQLLMVALVFRRRALPIAWTWIRSARGHSSARKQRALWTYIRGLLPANAPDLLFVTPKYDTLGPTQQRRRQVNKQAAHRPQRSYPNAERVLVECELEQCIHCQGPLVSSGTWHMRKYVQTLNGPLFVAGKSKQCHSPGCTHHGQHYHASGVLRISLPQSTYGLDVLAFIGWQHEHEHKQLVEIQKLLNQRGVAICESQVGRSYRQFLALLGGMNARVKAKLAETVKEHGGLIWGIDALQPEGHGTLLYVLYEVLSGTPVAGVQLDHPTGDELVKWLKPYQELPYMVLGTLSDGEDTLIAALETCRPEAPRRRCQEHFLGNLAAPVLEVDDELRKWLRDALGGLAAVPTESAPSAVESGAGQPPPIPPFCLTAQSRAMPS